MRKTFCILVIGVAGLALPVWAHGDHAESHATGVAPAPVYSNGGPATGAYPWNTNYSPQGPSGYYPSGQGNPAYYPSGGWNYPPNPGAWNQGAGYYQGGGGYSQGGQGHHYHGGSGYTNGGQGYWGQGTHNGCH